MIGLTGRNNRFVTSSSEKDISCSDGEAIAYYLQVDFRGNLNSNQLETGFYPGMIWRETVKQDSIPNEE